MHVHIHATSVHVYNMHARYMQEYATNIQKFQNSFSTLDRCTYFNSYSKFILKG